MRALWRWWDRYWFRPAPLADLAVCRVLFVSFQLFDLLQNTHRDVLSAGHVPAALFNPPLVLHAALRLATGGVAMPTTSAMEAVWWTALAAGGLALAGCATNVSLAVFAAACAVLQGFVYAFGELHHPQAAMMIALGLLACSPCGRALSVDAWLARRRTGSPPPSESALAAWPLLAIRWILVLVYLSAAVEKLQTAGWDWMNGHTLQYYMLRDALRWDRPVGLWLGRSYAFSWVLGWMSILFEATFLLAAVFQRLAWWVYLPLGLLFHLGIYVTMNAPFFSLMTLYAVFVPWTALWRWAGRRGAAVRS